MTWMYFSDFSDLGFISQVYGRCVQLGEKLWSSYGCRTSWQISGMVELLIPRGVESWDFQRSFDYYIFKLSQKHIKKWDAANWEGSGSAAPRNRHWVDVQWVWEKTCGLRVDNRTRSCHYFYFSHILHGVGVGWGGGINVFSIPNIQLSC